MSVSIFVRCIFIGVIVALPSPLVISALSDAFGFSHSTAVLLSTGVLASVGCLVSSLFGTKVASKEGGESGSVRSKGRETGTVKWFNVTKGFGFITRGKGEDVFVHYRSIRGNGRRSLSEGQSVEFTVSEGEKGLQADDVFVVR